MYTTKPFILVQTKLYRCSFYAQNTTQTHGTYALTQDYLVIRNEVSSRLVVHVKE
jgi:hypothetical protein